MRKKILLLLIALIGVLAACNAAPAPTPTQTIITPTETSDFVVVTGSGERATLPPTWTPTQTYTPAPPTLTYTPTTTFTPVPTYTAAEVCDHFTVTNTPREGHPYLSDASVPFLYLAEFPDALVHISIVNRETGSEQGGSYPAAATLGGSYAVDEPGTYDWSIGVIVPPYDELCQQTGTFTVVSAPTSSEVTPTPAPTAESTAEVTAESTAEATAGATVESLSPCPDFIVDPAFEDGQVFTEDDSISVLLETESDDVFIRFVVISQQSGESHTLQIPGGESFTLDLPIALLSGPDTYDWTASVFNDELGERCATTGTFVVEGSSATPTLSASATSTYTATASPTSTYTATAGATRRATFTPTANATRRVTFTPTPKPPSATPRP